MRLSRQNVVCGALVVASVAISSAVEGQDPRWAAQLVANAGSIPNVIGNGCWYHDRGTPSFGGAFTVIRRLAQPFVAVADLRGNWVTPFSGCKLVGQASTMIGPNEFESPARNTYPRALPEEPFVRSSLRFGVETPPGFMFARATLGAGMFWTGGHIPYAVGNLDIGTRGNVRVVLGLETNRTWYRRRSEFIRYTQDMNTVTYHPSRFESHVDWTGWTSLNLGLEIALR